MTKLSHFILWTAVAIFSALGCKPEKQADSSVNFDWSHSKNLDFNVLSKKHRAEICSRSPIVFFVGNAEHPLMSKPNRPSSFESSDKLNAVIVEAKKNLTHAMSRKPYGCESADGSDSRALLVFITDGPYKNDSEIETVWFKTDVAHARKSTKTTEMIKTNDVYSLAWVKDSASSNKWTYNSGQLTVQKTKANFELHLPTDLEKIVNFFVEQKPKDKPRHSFDQTIYMFKSHGGKFYKDGIALGWDKFFNAVNGDYEKKNAYHAFLFDRNASDVTKPASGLNIPLMKTAAACKEFASKIDNSKKPRTDLCAVCLPYLKAGSEGVFISCNGKTTTASKTEESPVKAESDEKTENPSSDLSTETKKSLSPTAHDSLSPTAHDSLSPTAHDSLSPTAHDSLSPTAHDSLSPTAHDSLSPTAHDSLSPTAHDSLSPTAHDSLSPTSHDSLGSSKTLVFADPIEDGFTEFDTLASGVAYTKLPFSVEGITNMHLPLKGSETNPPMIFLDSCWGDTSILDGAFDLIDSSTPIVITLNPNPMGLSAINYGALDYAQLLMYPSLQAGIKTRNEWASYEKMKIAIDDYMAKNGLTDKDVDGELALTAQPIEKSLRSISTFVIKDKKVIE